MDISTGAEPLLTRVYDALCADHTTLPGIAEHVQCTESEANAALRELLAAQATGVLGELVRDRARRALGIDDSLPTRKLSAVRHTASDF